MNSASEFKELKLSQEALICLAIATLRMMDLDIMSSTSKLQTEKIAQRKKFIESFKTYDLPAEVTNGPSGLNGRLRDLLYTSCGKVASRPNKVAVLTELCFVSPWDEMRIVLKKDIEDSDEHHTTFEKCRFFVQNVMIEAEATAGKDES
jgi:hypothetical protein